ncbi:MAG: tRNA (adenosine(37)-N6)-threonylcarbamoyltransferase complex dimerization subunit type 1 TsaB [Myxococcota bacterium]|nr:tRNA (adenosine(37)-N6)-threonylcarbamoyltransferase complex dimerization subunit type 1 TsaB [Myxococcota bacterium]
MAAERPLDDAPPLLLAVESSCRTPSVALLRGGEVVAEAEGRAGRTGAESLLPCVDQTLARAGVGLEAVTGFAVSIGPGSFTGLRVGVATVKGLAFASERPVACVPTLAALARGAAEACGAAAGDVVVALLDARRGEVYAAGWRIPGPMGEPAPVAPEEGVYTPEELAPLLPPGAWLAGEGVERCGERLEALAGPAAPRLGPAWEPRARDVGWLGLATLTRGDGVHVEALVPRYVRRAEAEVRRTGQRFE